MDFNGAKVFTATKFRDRERLGEDVTDWLRAHRDLEILSVDVRQSSDNEFHCLTIILWFRDPRIA